MSKEDETTTYSPARLRQHRRRLGMTQLQMAEHLKAHQTQVSGWETGSRSLSGRRLAEIERCMEHPDADGHEHPDRRRRRAPAASVAATSTRRDHEQRPPARPRRPTCSHVTRHHFHLCDGDYMDVPMLIFEEDPKGSDETTMRVFGELRVEAGLSPARWDRVLKIVEAHRRNAVEIDAARKKR